MQHVLYATLPVDANNRVTAAPRLLDSDTVDGLLLVGAFLDAPLYRLLGSGRLPLVLVDAYAAMPGVTRCFRGDALAAGQPQLTALFCCNDHVALHAARAAQRLGRRIPGDLSLAGFDDIDFAAHLEPPLTTMHVDKIAMGRLAVQQLEARFAFPTNDQVTALLRPRLVERNSVASLSRSEYALCVTRKE